MHITWGESVVKFNVLKFFWLKLQINFTFVLHFKRFKFRKTASYFCLKNKKFMFCVPVPRNLRLKKNLELNY